MMGLTRQQANALDFIRSSLDERGVAPSVVEIAEHLGLAPTSKATVARMLKSMELRGHIRRLPNHARAIELCPTRDVLRLFSDAALLAEVERRGLK